MSAPAPRMTNVPALSDDDPVRPVAPTSVLVHPAGATAETVTSPSVPVASADTSWLVTASPKSAVAGKAIVLLPTTVQLAPSAEIAALTTLPRRVSFTQRGAAYAPALV